MTPTDLLVDVAAAVRVSRLIMDDGITQPIRDAIVGWAHDEESKHPKLAARAEEFIDCPWCTTVWGAIVVVVARRARVPLPELLAAAELAGRIRAPEVAKAKASK